MSTSYWKYKQAGICYICQVRPLWGGHSTCDVCAREQRQRQQARVAQALAQGHCRKCFHQPQTEDSSLCVRCLTRVRRLQNPETRAQEITQHPLRQWQDGHKDGAFGLHQLPEQPGLWPEE